MQSGLNKTRLVLVYGPDEGLVRTRIGKLANAALGANGDTLSLIDLDAESLNSDPARLMDEANAISMFGGQRVIIIRHAGKLAKSIWQAAFTAAKLESTLLFQGDDLAKTSPLRSAVEASDKAVAIACYPPSADDVMALVEARCKSAGLSITPVARSFLASLLGADFALSEQEIEKLLLFCSGKLVIEITDIEAIITDSAESIGSEPIDLAFEGNMEAIEALALRTFREGINPAGMVTMALNHTLLLNRLVLAREAGNLDTKMRQEHIFFRRQSRVRQQAERWTLPLLARATEILSTAQEQSRRLSSLEETITIRALWSIALAARRKR